MSGDCCARSAALLRNKARLGKILVRRRDFCDLSVRVIRTSSRTGNALVARDGAGGDRISAVSSVAFRTPPPLHKTQPATLLAVCRKRATCANATARRAIISACAGAIGYRVENRFWKSTSILNLTNRTGTRDTTLLLRNEYRSFGRIPKSPCARFIFSRRTIRLRQPSIGRRHVQFSTAPPDLVWERCFCRRQRPPGKAQ